MSMVHVAEDSHPRSHATTLRRIKCALFRLRTRGLNEATPPAAYRREWCGGCKGHQIEMPNEMLKFKPAEKRDSKPWMSALVASWKQFQDHDTPSGPPRISTGESAGTDGENFTGQSSREATPATQKQQKPQAKSSGSNNETIIHDLEDAAAVPAEDVIEVVTNATTSSSRSNDSLGSDRADHRPLAGTRSLPARPLRSMFDDRPSRPKEPSLPGGAEREETVLESFASVGAALTRLPPQREQGATLERGGSAGWRRKTSSNEDAKEDSNRTEGNVAPVVTPPRTSSLPAASAARTPARSVAMPPLVEAVPASEVLVLDEPSAAGGISTQAPFSVSGHIDGKEEELECDSDAGTLGSSSDWDEPDSPRAAGDGRSLVGAHAYSAAAAAERLLPQGDSRLELGDARILSNSWDLDDEDSPEKQKTAKRQQFAAAVVDSGGACASGTAGKAADKCGCVADLNWLEDDFDS